MGAKADNPIIWGAIKSTFKNYFSEEDSPFNIAIFRIIFFLFILTYIDQKQIFWFSQLPSDLMFPPVGMKHLLSVIPVTPDLAHKAMILFIGFSFFAMIGCFARTSSFLAAISGIYVLGIPQFYGKVDHYNHLIWLMLILSVSRCADVLSIDSIWKAIRDADQGLEPKNQNSVAYALPLRFIWLLMGMVYFFPGFWKLFRTPWYWAWSDNLKYHMYFQWHEIGGSLPFFRLDQHPFLYKMCGLGVISFELAFVFLVLFPILRPLAAISGILFHSLIRVFMQFGFIHLEICYLSFINWAGLFAEIGKWIIKEPLTVRYDGKSKQYQRMIAVWSKFDIFQRIVFSDKIRASKKTPHDRLLLKFTGIALLLINFIFGFRETISGWPFACYPTFSQVFTKAISQTITPNGVMENGEDEISLRPLQKRMHQERFAGMIRSILRMPDKVQQRVTLKALASVMKAEGIDLKNYSKIRFYEAIYSTEPEKANNPPIFRKLLAEIDL